MNDQMVHDSPEPVPNELDQRLLGGGTVLLLIAFAGMSGTLFASTSPQPLRPVEVVTFFCSLAAVMVVLVAFTRRNRGLKVLVSVSPTARVAFGMDVCLAGLIFATMVVRFFLMSYGLYQLSFVSFYIALAILGVGAAGLSIEGIAIATGIRSPERVLGLLHMMKQNARRSKPKRWRL